MSDSPALGIDVGGTKIAVGLCDERGEFQRLDEYPTARFDGAANLRAVRDAIERHLPLGSTVGISLATTSDAGGVARDPRGWFGWTGWNLRERLADLAPVTVVPDAACGAVAEARWGAGAGARRLLYITLGTGIAHCLVDEGVPQLGVSGAGTLSGSSIPFASSWPVQRHWRSVEDIASGPGLASGFAGGEHALDAHPIAQAYRGGEWHARRTAEHAAWQAGALISTLTTALDPDRIVLGGGLATGFPEYAGLIDAVAEVLLDDWHLDLTPLSPARFGSDSCWIGAASLSMDVPAPGIEPEGTAS